MASGMINRVTRSLAVALFAIAFAAVGASAAPYLVVDAGSGATLIENQATVPWYPASVTKLMTTYVALNAVREGRLTMDTPLTVSMRAARMAPSKMGFNPGTEVTLDNALKMLLVKSPNDIAVMIAEGIDGSVEGFADEMNATARKLGLQESHFVNPNGLHDPSHYSSARDMAIIARALLTDFPEHADLFDIGAIQLGDQIIQNHNGLLGHYPGADGMKTGFTCSAGFNVVATATHNGRKLIVVVMGSPSARERNMEAAELFERGFAQRGDGPTLQNLPRSAQAAPQDQRSEICSRRNRVAVAAAEEEVFGTPAGGATAPAAVANGRGSPAFVTASAAAEPVQPVLSTAPVHFDPVPVFVGPKEGWTGPVLAARPVAGAPEDASAYAGDKGEGAQENRADASAPLALQGSVKPPETPAEAHEKAKTTKVAAEEKPRRQRRTLLRKPKAGAAAHP